MPIKPKKQNIVVRLPDAKDTVWAYIAGLAEKACFIINRKTIKGKTRYWPEIKLSCRSDKLADYLGYFCFKSPVDSLADKRQDRSKIVMRGYTIRVIGYKALDLNKRILPYLIEKRNQSLIFEAFLSVKKEDMRGGPVSPEELFAYQLLYEALAKLKHRINPGKANNWKQMNEAKKRRLLADTYHENIFDLFDGSFTVETSNTAKSIFDEFLK